MKIFSILILIMSFPFCKSVYQDTEKLIHTKIKSSNFQKNVYIIYSEVPGAKKIDEFSNFCSEFFLLKFWLGRYFGHSRCDLELEDRIEKYDIPEDHYLILHKITPVSKANFFIDHLNNLWAPFYSAYSPWPHVNYLYINGEIASIHKKDFYNYIPEYEGF